MSIREVFLRTARASHSVIGSDAARRRWDEHSALAQWSVAGLCGHLARATTSVDHYLDRGHPERQPISPAEYYSRAVGEIDLDSDHHRAIRQRGIDFAADGHAALISKHGSVLDRLETRLQTEPRDRKIEVFQDLVLVLDDYLITRLIELTVHVDDLCVSLDVEPPELPAEAYNLSIATLVDVARHRHGDLAVLRALSRRERDDINALRVL